MTDKKYAGPEIVTNDWEVRLYGSGQDKTVTVQATSKQEAMNKAMRDHQGLYVESCHLVPVETGKWYVVTIARSGDLDDGMKDVEVRAHNQSAAITVAVTGNPGWYYAGSVSEGRIIKDEAISGPEIWQTDWKPSVGECEELTLANIVGQAIGTASLCWTRPPEGIFDDEKARWVMGGAVNAIEKLIYDQQKQNIENEYTKIMQEPCVGETGLPELSDADKQRRLQRDADKATLIDWILHYKNPANEEEKLRQIRIVME